MKTTGIKRIMSAFGCTDNVPARIKELTTINLRSNGNQSVDPELDEITFDIANEMIKIKEYSAEIRSGLLVNGNIEGNKLKSYMLKCKKNKIRPKVGDSIIAFDKETSAMTTIGKIESLSSDEIVVSKELPIDDSILGFASAEDIAICSQSIWDPRFLVKYIPLTEYKTDIYLSFFSVVGFSTLNPYSL